MSEIEIPYEVKRVLRKINRFNKSKVSVYYIETGHPLSTGFVIYDLKKDSNTNSMFYSLLSLDFYFFSNTSKEIYIYLENDGALKHTNNFFDKDIVKSIKKYLVTL